MWIWLNNKIYIRRDLFLIIRKFWLLILLCSKYQQKKIRMFFLLFFKKTIKFKKKKLQEPIHKEWVLTILIYYNFLKHKPVDMREFFGLIVLKKYIICDISLLFLIFYFHLIYLGDCWDVKRIDVSVKRHNSLIFYSLIEDTILS